MKRILADTGFRTLILGLFGTLVIGYAWGNTITQYRPIIREPGEALFILSELFMYSALLIFIYIQRDEYISERFLLRKFIVFHSVIALASVHIINTFFILGLNNLTQRFVV